MDGRNMTGAELRQAHRLVAIDRLRVYEAADLLGVTEPTLRYHFTEWFGYPAKEARLKADRKRVTGCLKAGMSASETARALEMSQSAVIARAKEEGWTHVGTRTHGHWTRE